MQAKSWIMLKALLNHFHHSEDSLLRYLPPEDAAGVRSQKIAFDNAAVALQQPKDFVEKIHYSWLLPALKKLPAPLHNTLLAVLPEGHSSKLGLLLKQTPVDTGASFADPVRVFLLNTLYKHVKPAEILPVEFLPQTSLSELANWNKQQLIELIDILGLYDLAEEMRYIIDQKRVKQFYTHLSKKQKPFLRECLHQKEKITATPLNLKLWDGSRRTLERLLHQRGIVRLGKALCGQHPDLLWYIKHILDVGRGAALEKHYSPQALPGVTPVLIQQVLNAIKYLEPKSAS